MSGYHSNNLLLITEASSVLREAGWSPETIYEAYTSLVNSALDALSETLVDAERILAKDYPETVQGLVIARAVVEQASKGALTYSEALKHLEDEE